MALRRGREAIGSASLSSSSSSSNREIEDEDEDEDEDEKAPQGKPRKGRAFRSRRADAMTR
jgi:hypothetical protein